MAHTVSSQIGYLVPLKQNSEEEDTSIPKLPLSRGPNTIGRHNIPVPDKRLSRNHLTLTASPDSAPSVNLTVQGTNPVVVKSGGKRKKLSPGDKACIRSGDIIELIPGHHFYKYVLAAHGSQKRASNEGKQVTENERFSRKKIRGESGNDVTPSGVSKVKGKGNGVEDNEEAIRDFRIPDDKLPSTFRLLRVKELPPWANTSCVSITDVIQGDILVAILSNYMVDIDWLMSACPALAKVPHVMVVHGEGDGTLEHMKRKKPANWILHKPPLPISFGTHHSKAMLLVYPRGVRIIVHTANLIYVDWNNKSQGLWMQDFPWKDENNPTERSGFENDLVDYLNALKWPEFSAQLPPIGNFLINPAFFKKFDYSTSMVRLIASVPGYHTGANLKKWGHVKLHTVLQECTFDKEFKNSPLVYQFSSLGSLDEKWMAEFTTSMSSGFSEGKMPLGLGEPLMIWPTVEDVRCSLELVTSGCVELLAKFSNRWAMDNPDFGASHLYICTSCIKRFTLVQGYAAGNAIPSPLKNVEKNFLKKYWAKWRATHTGRSRAMPHIKTFTRYSGQNLAWFLLTSANLSKAAWGALQKNNSQLMIRSYELGVLFLPSAKKTPGSRFSCTKVGSPSKLQDCGSSLHPEVSKTKLVTLRWKGTTEESSQVIPLPVPYELPPPQYTSEDVPWSWDRRYSKKDVYGQVWPRPAL
ncbi:tyrosyl-DNA phosphodiesterase 1 [Turnera subulata]|uniref:Tyrosyl-DNA phosphodiesterase 1 n=1 Tax=Turnera subulata TaxID=218843 RepID=A0A9Q0FWB8_9ROSI|nr:tyrosyl-DNA phosphodiesterase 1 [Turnera subulata]